MTVFFDHAELLRRAVDDRLSSLHTALPGKIVSYDAATQTANVEPQVREGGETLPVIQKVRVGWPRGGDGYLVFPIEAGDYGLLVFCERDITSWVTAGEAENAGDVAKHSLQGAVFYPGIFPSGHDLDAPSGASVLSGGDVRLGGSGAVDYVLKGDQWKTALDSWLISVSTWAVACQVAITMAGGPPTAGADYISATNDLVTAFQASLSAKVKVE